jgi:hypothetical protein
VIEKAKGEADAVAISDSPQCIHPEAIIPFWTFSLVFLRVWV